VRRIVVDLGDVITVAARVSLRIKTPIGTGDPDDQEIPPESE